MTRDDMLRMAWEAGLVRFEGGELEAYGVGKASPSDHSVAAWSVATEQKLAHFFALAAAAELHCLAAVEAQRDALLEALQALYDEQQGPPLIRHQAAWEAAMQKARAAIAKAEEKT